jgi:uncharacterized protein (DUF779 family)
LSAPVSTISATAGAVELAERLVRLHGPLALFQSAGCCDGSTPICVAAADLPPAAHDRCLGTVAGIPFYIDDSLYHRWNEPDFILDVAPGAPEGLSVGLRDAHFVTR